MLLGHEDAVKEFMKLKGDEVNRALIELLECGKIDFTSMVEKYVNMLRARHKKEYASIATLGLMLSFYCATDNSPAGKNARKHLYESGAYTGKDGSGFGAMLEEEFGEKNESK